LYNDRFQYKCQKILTFFFFKALSSDEILICLLFLFKALSSDEMEATTQSGLVKGHAYGITAIKNIHLESQTFFSRFFKDDNKIPMIRLRNPWGQCEWKGAFSDG
jgi:calpain-5